MNRILGCDLGQANDSTGLILLDESLKRTEDGIVWNCPYIQRVELHTPYTKIVEQTATLLRLLSEPQLAREPIELTAHDGWKVITSGPITMVEPKVTLVLDYTGVGRPVLDMFLDAQHAGKIPDSVDIIAVTITGGQHVTWDEYGVHVPKRELVGTTQRLFQDQRLKVANGLPMAPALLEELKGFKAVISSTGHISYQAGEDWRSAPHDDLVLALALACWYAETTVMIA